MTASIEEDDTKKFFIRCPISPISQVFESQILYFSNSRKPAHMHFLSLYTSFSMSEIVSRIDSMCVFLGNFSTLCKLHYNLKHEILKLPAETRFEMKEESSPV